MAQPEAWALAPGESAFPQDFRLGERHVVDDQVRTSTGAPLGVPRDDFERLNRTVMSIRFWPGREVELATRKPTVIR